MRRLLLSVAEAAARAGVNVGALKVRAHRGYRSLRKVLEKMGINSVDAAGEAQL